jgi:hypothetical protein
LIKNEPGPVSCHFPVNYRSTFISIIFNPLNKISAKQTAQGLKKFSLSDKRSPDSIKGLPFEIKIPNDETLAAMSEAEQLNGDFVSIDDFAR